MGKKHREKFRNTGKTQGILSRLECGHPVDLYIPSFDLLYPYRLLYLSQRMIFLPFHFDGTLQKICNLYTDIVAIIIMETC